MRRGRGAGGVLPGGGLRRLAAAGVVVAFAAVAAALLSRPRGEAWSAPASAASSCAELSPAARRGKLLFRRGTTAAGRPVTALLGGGPASIEGRDAACAGCHTYSGAGGEEGSLAAPPITPERLFREVPGRGERARPAYEVASLLVAIREGRTPSGRRLGMGMPRYRLETEEVEDLVSYLRCLGQDRDPGVLEDRVRVGAALPLTGPLAEIGADVRAVLAASFSDVGAEGGVFRRSIELVVEDSGGAAGEAGAAARLEAADLLALVGSVGGEGRAPGGVGGDDGVPLVAPIGPRGDAQGADLDGDGGRVFHVGSGARGLARAALRALTGPADVARDRVLVAHARGRAGEAWLVGAREEAGRRGAEVASVLPFDEGRLDDAALAEGAAAAGATAILLWGGAADLARGVAALERAPGVPMAVPGHLIAAARETLPASVRDRVFFVSPALGVEGGPRGAEGLRDLQARHGIPSRHLAVQARARVAALVFVEALKRAGARPSRDGLVAALETFRDFDTGLAPPLSYGKGRRVGAIGASLVQLGVEARAPERSPVWIGLAP